MTAYWAYENKHFLLYHQSPTITCETALPDTAPQTLDFDTLNSGDDICRWEFFNLHLLISPIIIRLINNVVHRLLPFIKFSVENVAH